MFQEPLTAEFALEQLQNLCASDDNDTDIMLVDKIDDLLTRIAKSDWQSPEEFFKFYEAVGYELFTTAALSEEATLFDVEVNLYHGIVEEENFFALYARAHQLIAQDESNKQYAHKAVAIPSDCQVEASEVDNVIDLIPGAAAYTWDSAYYATWGGHDFNELQTRFFCDIIYFFSGGYVDNGIEEVAILQLSEHASQPSILSAIYDNGIFDDPESLTLELIENFSTNSSTPTEILQEIATNLYEIAEDWDADEKESVCSNILEHPNCTDEIREAIDEFLAEQE